jgi:membrane-associated phospholipid phosphatase
MLGRVTPPRLRLPRRADTAVGRFDRAVDDWFEIHLRTNKVANAVFYGASALGDHGILWILLATTQAARRARQGAPVQAWRTTLLRDVGALAVESALVNGPVKWVFRRERPVQEAPRPMRLRQPRTSSFPSGHATAAFFGAALLRDDDPIWPLYYALAVVTASSRVHVRIHHASDVVAGIALGAVLGEVARRVLPR